MSQVFLLGDFIAHVKNCVLAKLQFVSFRHSKMIESVCKILMNDGYISYYEVSHDDFRKNIRLKLIHHKGLPTIQILDLCSKPSKRIYKKSREIRPFKNGIGLTILSTSSGIMSYRDAIKQGIGGEVLCVVF